MRKLTASSCRGFAAALALALCVALPCVAARASEVQQVSPATATSTCIGESGNPRCVVDTLMACFARAARSLCARIGAEPPEAAPEPRRLEYFVERESEIRADQITDDLREVAWFKPGFMLIELQIRACGADAADCDAESWEDLQVYLRQQGSAWRIVHWRAPGDPDAPVQIPDALR